MSSGHPEGLTTTIRSHKNPYRRRKPLRRDVFFLFVAEEDVEFDSFR